MKSTWPERLLCMFGIAFLFSVIMPRASAAPMQGLSLKAYLLNAAFYGLVALFSMIYWRRMESVLVRAASTVALILLALASTTWSASPEVTLKRVALLCGTSLFGIYFGSRFSTKEQIDLVGNTLLILGVFSIVVALGRPTYGLDDESHIGAWRGVFAHKNTLGRAMVLGVCAFLCMPTGTPFRKMRRALGLFICLALIVMSRSRDAAIITVVLFAVTAVTLKFRSRLFLGGGVAVVAALVAGYVYFPETSAALLQALGRDATLTGRTDIWRACFESISMHPILGHGFGAFWRGLDGPSIAVIASAGWMVPHAHNGYLDLVLDLGLVGLLVFGIGYFRTLMSAIDHFYSEPDRQHWWPILYLSYLFLSNLGESSILMPNSIFWALYVACAASQIKRYVEADERQAQQVWKLRTRMEIRSELPAWMTARRDEIGF